MTQDDDVFPKLENLFQLLYSHHHHPGLNLPLLQLEYKWLKPFASFLSNQSFTMLSFEYKITAVTMLHLFQVLLKNH
jgi:hypothetical protein